MILQSCAVAVTLLLITATMAIGSDFTTNLDTTYTLTSTDTIQVSQVLSITNNSAIRFPISFDLTIPSNIGSSIQVLDATGKSAQFETEKADRFTKLTILFGKPIVGINKNQRYTIEYSNPSILFSSYPTPQFLLPAWPNLNASVSATTKLVIPESRCPTPTTYPKAITTETSNGLNQLMFSGIPSNQSIFIRCADKRYRAITLHYYLTNSNMTPIETQITLPPDTNYQQIFFNDINPLPLNISTDNDNNVIASFRLEPKESKRITVTGNAVISATPLHSISPPSPLYLSPKTYWPSQDSSIKNIVKELSGPEAIYRYLIANVTLDPTNGSKRQGGGMVASKPGSLQPIDLVDSFITMSRAKNSMSRRLIGFSESPNSVLWPTTLLENTLHLWTEYYDATQNQWIQIDPLWEKTSTANFFPIRDMNHIVLAINGTSDTTPYPVGYYQSPGNTGPDIQIVDREPFTLPPIQVRGTIKESFFHLLGITKKTNLHIENLSLFSLYNEPASLIIDNESPQQLILPRLPLQGQAIIPINLPKNYETATLIIGNTSFKLTSIRSSFAKPLIIAPLLAGISGILAVVTRRLLVSRRKK